MKRSPMRLLASLIIVFAGGFGESCEPKPAAGQAGFTINIDLRGLIAFVDLAQKRMYALLPKADDKSLFNCSTNLTAKEHYAALRVKDKYTTSGTGSDAYHLYFIMESEVRIAPCQQTTYSTTGLVASMNDLAGTAKVCAGCADSNNFDPKRLAGRILLNQAKIDFGEPLPPSGAKQWQVGAKPYATLAEKASTSYTGCTGTQEKVVLARWNGTMFEDHDTLIFYPKKGVIEFEILNVPANVLYRDFPVGHIKTKTVDHFAWFYALSPKPTGTGSCDVPVDPNLAPSFIPDDMKNGMPYCPFVTFTQ